MDRVGNLYQALVLDHSIRPRNFGALENPTHSAEDHNPVCGARLRVYVSVEHDVIREARFDGDGCAICLASASLLTTAVAGRKPQEARTLVRRFRMSLEGPASEDDGSVSESLGKLQVLAGVRDFPGRIKCATLPGSTLVAALDRTRETISTEEALG